MKKKSKNKPVKKKPVGKKKPTAKAKRRVGNGKIAFRDRVKVWQPAWRRALCSNLRNRRVQLGLTQKRLGEMAGVVQQWIGQLEDPMGDEVPSLYQLADLAVALDCTMIDLLHSGKFDIGITVGDDMRRYQHETSPVRSGKLDRSENPKKELKPKRKAAKAKGKEKRSKRAVKKREPKSKATTKPRSKAASPKWKGRK